MLDNLKLTVARVTRSATGRGLAMAVAGGATLLAGPTTAMAGVVPGFKGPFAPNAWDLDFYSNVLVPQPPVTQAPYEPSSTPVTSLPDGNYPSGYLCFDDNSVACINNLDTEQGIMRLVGSDYTEEPEPSPYSNGEAGESWAIQWESDPITAPTTVSFDWSYFTFDESADDQSYYYTIDALNNIDTVLLSSEPTGDSGSISLNLLAGSRLGFGVHTASNTGGPGYLNVVRFSYTAPDVVPGPLPLLGAGAAFGWSRRLRQRLVTSAKSSKR
ncbi:MAG: hypothetical protein VKO65_05775 [Cyanobacteriota bacterium]|nr:hypothetical protein [Cyanobacteriota bacterium]